MQQIANYPNYAITKDGKVWVKVRYDKHGRKAGGRWLKPQTISRGGHQYVALYVGGQKRIRLIHRLVLETYIGPCPKGMECRHLNGNPMDNQLDNLKWGTKSENTQDSLRHGTHRSVNQSGEKNTNAKISNQKRRLIIYQYSTGLFTQSELARMYGLSPATILDLVSGKAWPHIDAKKIKEIYV